MNSSRVAPETGLVWLANYDPSVGGAVAPLYQFLIRTDNNSLYYKADTGDLQWSAIAGGGGGGGNGIAASAGTQSVSTGTVVWANSNGISFGMSGSSQITASADYVRSLSAGTTNATGNQVVFSNSNGVSFGANGGTITASVAAQSVAPAAISAGTTLASTGTVVFSNSNSVSFGMNGNTVTASVSTQPETPFGISAGTQSVSTGTVVFSNSNGITFGMSGSSRITASYGEVTHSLFAPAEFGSGQSAQFGQNTVQVHPVTIPYLTFSQFAHLVFYSGATNSTATLSCSLEFGVYTRTGDSLSLLASTSASFSINHSGNVNNSLYAGNRNVTIAWASSLSRGDYWMAMLSSTATAGAAVSLTNGVIQQAATQFSGVMGQANGVTPQMLGWGQWSATTASLPSSMAFADIQGSGIGQNRIPIYWLGVSTT